MSTAKPDVLVAFDLADELRETLETLSNRVKLHYVTRPDKLRTRLEAIKPEVVFSIKGPNFPAKAHRPIVEVGSVQWVQVGGSGFDHLLPWDRERLTVTNCAGVLAPFLAETAMGALLALNGNFLDYFRQQQQSQWLPHEFRPLSDKTLLIVGLGHIGQLVADRAKAFGMRVIATKRRKIEHPSVDSVYCPEQLPEIIHEADVVSVHLRLNQDTERLFDTGMFAKMKHGALLLNTSRGLVIDEAALISALESGHIGGAYLDVFEEEPLSQSSPLWSMPNVLITPHCADDIVGWHRKFAQFFVANVNRWLRGDAMMNPV